MLCLTLLSPQPTALTNQLSKIELMQHNLECSSRMQCNASFTTKCSMQAVPGCRRQAARVATKMLSMAVQADKLCISANEAGVDDGEAMTDSQVRFIHHITYASHMPLMHACPGFSA